MNMVLIARQQGDSLIIGDLKITIYGAEDNKVLLAIKLPEGQAIQSPPRAPRVSRETLHSTIPAPKARVIDFCQYKKESQNETRR